MSNRELPYDLRKTVRWSVPLTWVHIATHVMLACHSIWLLSFFSWIESGDFGETDPVTYGTQIDNVGAVVGTLYTLAFIATVIANGMWIYRASSNAGHMAPSSARITPGWSVGWYFIPFANLVKPYEAMRQTWVTSLDPGAQLDAAGPSLLHQWWFGWLVGGFLATASLRIALNSSEIAPLRTGEILGLAGAILLIWSAFLFIKVQHAVTAAQAAHGRVAEILE